MSRTFRRTRLESFSKYSNPLRDYGILYDEEGNGYWRHFYVDAKTREGKVLLAKFHSDRGHGWMSYQGPSWFATMFSQVPYRTRSKQSIHNWVRHGQEVLLETKPHLEYWL